MNRIVVLLLTIVFAVNVSALEFIGQPNADVNHPQIKIGLNYSNSYNDIDMDHQNLTIQKVDINKFYVDFSFSVLDDLELIFRLGAADFHPDKNKNDDYILGHIGTSNPSFMIGGGIKATLYKNDYMKWGLSAIVSGGQFGWDKIDTFKISDVNYYDVDVDGPYLEAMLFTGPNFKIHDNVNIYGGPFIHIISGTFHVEETVENPANTYTDFKTEYDYRQDSIIGVLAGTQIKLDDKLEFCIEYQKTNSAAGLAGGMIFRF